jgi:hypothetical protein
MVRSLLMLACLCLFAFARLSIFAVAGECGYECLPGWYGELCLRRVFSWKEEDKIRDAIRAAEKGRYTLWHAQSAAYDAYEQIKRDRLADGCKTRYWTEQATVDDEAKMLRALIAEVES